MDRHLLLEKAGDGMIHSVSLLFFYNRTYFLFIFRFAFLF